MSLSVTGLVTGSDTIITVTSAVTTRANSAPAIPFISTWTTTTSDQVVTLPLIASGTYDFTVDWGDSSSDTITAFGDAAKAHTYAGAGATYTITITGTCQGWQFANSASASVLTTVTQWGDLDPAATNAFWGCTNATFPATDGPIISTTDLSGFFRSCTSMVTAPDFSQWDTSSVTNFTNFFLSCSSFNSSVAGLDVSSATNFLNMFHSCAAFNQDCSGLATHGAVTSFNSMFYGCTIFNSSVAGLINGDSATAGAMFNLCPAFNHSSVVAWDVSGITAMNAMFQFNSANSTFQQDLSAWDISSLTNALNMFLNRTLSTAIYNSLLIGWDANIHNNTVTFHGGSSKYTGGGAAATARANLVGDGWTITDGGTA